MKRGLGPYLLSQEQPSVLNRLALPHSVPAAEHGIPNPTAQAARAPVSEGLAHCEAFQMPLHIPLSWRRLLWVSPSPELLQEGTIHPQLCGQDDWHRAGPQEIFP